ncbi:MAG: hypothetical protein K6G03_09370 [Lachnospiraceae bacterium]|nr:hypothetical protein [Lachnospiraceae bacterium]
MLTLIFAILFIVTFGKMLLFAIKAGWTIFKIIMFIVFLPLILIVMVFAGLIYLALPILLIIGIISLVFG